MMNPTLAILQSPVEPWQKRNRLASQAESALAAPGLTPGMQDLFGRGILCDLFEGNAPYRPRYALPDYQALLARGSAYLDLAPPRDLFEAVGALLAAYRFVPSITGFPVYVGQLDDLLEPFWEQEAPATRERLLELLLVQIDRTLPDAFVHLNLGPRDTAVGRSVLALDRKLRKAVPNISLKVAPETPDTFLEAAAAAALETGKPYFVNHPALTQALGGPYGVASCYNTLPLGGGAHTLVRLNLAALAKECPDPARFKEAVLPDALEALAACMEARIRFLVEEARFFESSFLVKEGFLSLDRFTAMAGVFGLYEAVETLTGGLRMGRDPEADRLAETLVLQARDQIKARPVPYCEGTGGRLAFHAQSGIATDMDATPGVRIRPGQEPGLPAQLALAARLQPAFDAGASEILLFEPTARRNPAALVRIIRGALAQGLRILAVGTSDSELVRITGYLAKRTDLAREGRENLREESVSLAAGALRNGRAAERTARPLVG
jgi:YjjI family glycine radical enzyme